MKDNVVTVANLDDEQNHYKCLQTAARNPPETWRNFWAMKEEARQMEW